MIQRRNHDKNGNKRSLLIKIRLKFLGHNQEKKLTLTVFYGGKKDKGG